MIGLLYLLLSESAAKCSKVKHSKSTRHLQDQYNSLRGKSPLFNLFLSHRGLCQTVAGSSKLQSLWALFQAQQEIIVTQVMKLKLQESSGNYFSCLELQLEWWLYTMSNK